MAKHSFSNCEFNESEKRTVDKFFEPIFEATEFAINTITKVGYSKFSSKYDGVELYYFYISETSSCRVELKIDEYSDSLLMSSFRGWKGGYTGKYGSNGHIYLDFPCEKADDIFTFARAASDVLKFDFGVGSLGEWHFYISSWFDD